MEQRYSIIWKIHAVEYRKGVDSIICTKHTLTDRQSNIELLRIISMMMIVFHHFAVHGGFVWEQSDASISHFWYNLISMAGKIGVDVFVLISGYFLIESRSGLFNLKKLLKLWGQVFFYSVGLYAVFSLFKGDDYGIKTLLKSLFPITFSSWWFASTYFVLYLIHPFLNIFLNSLERRNYQTLLVILVTMWSVIPTIINRSVGWSYLGWFVTLYSIAGYARLYGFNKIFTAKRYFILWAVFSSLTYLSSTAFTILGTRWKVFYTHISYFFGMEKLSVLLISLTLFMAFSSLDIGYHKWINTLASATFGVYLIHDSDFVRSFLWVEVFQNAEYRNSLFLIPYSIIVVIVVYAVCTAIDLLRKAVFEKPYMLLVDRYSDTLIRPFDRICRFFRKIVFG